MNKLNGSFVNTLYKGTWAKLVPGTNAEYKNGTYVSKDGVDYAVYDGATNYIGRVNKETGELTSNGAMTEYKASFLICAIDSIV